jgi:hypothetical protein
MIFIFLFWNLWNNKNTHVSLREFIFILFQMMCQKKVQLIEKNEF